MFPLVQFTKCIITCMPIGHYHILVHLTYTLPCPFCPDVLTLTTTTYVAQPLITLELHKSDRSVKMLEEYWKC